MSTPKHTLDTFLDSERTDMLSDLTATVEELKTSMKLDPKLFTEAGCDEPSIDVRLCVDLERGSAPSWIIRTGSSDYDQYHSEYCSASCIGLDTDPKELLEELMNDLGDV